MALPLVVFMAGCGGGSTGGGVSDPAICQGSSCVSLGTAANDVILAKTGIDSVPTSAVIGDLGMSPAAASFITGFTLDLPVGSAFSTSAQVTGKVYENVILGSRLES